MEFHKDNVVKVSKPRSRDDIKAELIGQAFSKKGGVVIFYGAGGISRDMARVLNPNEKMLSFYHAHRSSVLGQMKGSRMFRSYIVCTDQRDIYILKAAGCRTMMDNNDATKLEEFLKSNSTR